jgi:hypothetical protein
VFYYPVEDAMEWIRQNYVRYPIRHCLALIANHPELILHVNALYKEKRS